MMAMMLYGEARTTKVREQIRAVQQVWHRQLDQEITNDEELVRYLSQMAETMLQQSRFCQAFLYLRRQLRQYEL
jgi:hypothetical protein